MISVVRSMSNNERTELARWTELWQALRAAGDPAPWHERLVRAYGGAERPYHNLRHIGECLTELDTVRAAAQRPALVECALWFHDAVYESRATDNEEASARLAAECLREAGLDATAIADVEGLILATKSHTPSGEADAALVVDIDLAILGQGADRFWEYERAIRAEYAWVPAATLARERRKILERFLARSAIYQTRHFREKYEATARANLAAAIERLNEQGG